MTNPLRNRASSVSLSAVTSDPCPVQVRPPRAVPNKVLANAKKPLRVMKFGGTSVNDASCIEKVADIIKAATQDSDVVVVVSAMRGVTDKLVEAATQSEQGNQHGVAAIFQGLRERHEAAANLLVHSAEQRELIVGKLQRVFQEGERLCQEVIQQRELTQRACDSITGLGERLSAPLVAAALEERGVASEAIDATELVITDSRHGAAEPLMDITRERCEARLLPLLLQGIIPVVTGFIGATAEGVPTTLGRNSSDYSGTIMGAALDADDVSLWTDVDGILTTDPKLVSDASSILEMSYGEASDLAELGAKVLHPKTLHALMQRGIPLSIRNTFAPDHPGTRITPKGSANGTGVKAVTITKDVAITFNPAVAIVTLVGDNVRDRAGMVERLSAALARHNVSLIGTARASSGSSLSFVVSQQDVKAALVIIHQELELGGSNL
jgi:bifunctional aspartokinase / homoserine dehydrogenase 1